MMELGLDVVGCGEMVGVSVRLEDSSDVIAL